MKKFVFGTLILAVLVFFVWPNHDKKEEENIEVRTEPISDIGFADPEGIELVSINIEDINKDNAVETVLGYYGLELNIPDAWNVLDAKGKYLNDLDSETEIIFEDVTYDDAILYIENFYEEHHLGDKALKKFKVNDNEYKWDVQIKGVSIKDTYDLKIEDNKLTLFIGKYY